MNTVTIELNIPSLNDKGVNIYSIHLALFDLEGVKLQKDSMTFTIITTLGQLPKVQSTLAKFDLV